MFSVHLQGATTVGGGVSVATCLSLTRAKIRKCNCLIYGPVLGRLCDGVHLCLRPALSGETGYKHACCTAFKHHRGPNHRDGLNTSYAERLVRASAIVGFRLAAVGEVRLGICIQLNTPPVYLLTFNVLTACVHAHFQTRFFLSRRDRRDVHDCTPCTVRTLWMGPLVAQTRTLKACAQPLVNWAQCHVRVCLPNL